MTVRELDRPPNVTLLYGRAAVASLGGGGGGPLPGDVVVLCDARADVAHLAPYARVCGFRLRDRLPPTYLRVLAFPLVLELIARPSFPLPPTGIIHVADHITHRRPVDAAERLTLRARVAGLRPHSRGRQFDAITEVEAGGEIVWQETSTYLRRGPAGRGDGRPAPTDEDAPPDDDASPGNHAPRDPGAPRADGAAVWHLPADVGRRYAAASGDRNPIHTSRLAARALGLPGMIAHGMWTAARCLAAVEPRLPDRFEVAVSFRKPVVLPARVAFAAAVTAAGWTLELRPPDGRGRHLYATVTTLGDHRGKGR